MKLKLTKKQQRTVLDRIWADYEFGLNARRFHEEDWRKADDQYQSEWHELEKVQDDEDLAQSWFYVPKTRMVISRIVASLNQHFLPRGRKKLARIGTESRRPEVELAATIVDPILHAKLDKELQPERFLPAAWESAMLKGTGWIKIHTQLVDRTSADQEFYRGLAVDGEFVDSEYVAYDPFATSDDQIKWVVHELWMTPDELFAKQAAGIYENVEDVVEAYYGPADKQDADMQALGRSPNKPRNQIPILEFWGPVQPRSDEELERMHKRGRHEPEIDVVAVMYKNLVLLRVEENRYGKLFDEPRPFEKLPFFRLSPIPKAGTTWHDSLALLMRPLQRETNSIRNQRRAAVDLETNPKAFYDATRLTDTKRLLQARWGGMVPTNGPPQGVVEQFKFETSTHILDREEQIVDNDIRDLTGVTYIHMGGAVPGMQDTATGMNLIAGEGNVKLDTLIDNIAMTGIVPLSNFVLQCIIEWMTPKEIEEIVGPMPSQEEMGQMPMPQQIGAESRMDMLGLIQQQTVLKALARDFQVEVEAGASATSKAVQIQEVNFGLTALGQVSNSPALAEPAAAAGRVLIAKLLRLLGEYEAGQVFTEQQAMGAQTMPPAGAQMQALPNQQAQGSMAVQGRRPTPQEARR